MRDEGPRGLYKKRYNVAKAGQARNQLWVDYSVNPVHISNLATFDDGLLSMLAIRKQ